jgi:hypothetical protein
MEVLSEERFVGQMALVKIYRAEAIEEKAESAQRRGLSIELFGNTCYQ